MSVKPAGMKTSPIAAALLFAAAVLAQSFLAHAADWIEVGADTEAKYYVDVESIEVDGENVLVKKKGIFTHVLTDTFGGKTATFKETIGTVQIDCGRRINRIIQIDMIGEDGAVAWSSGPMQTRMWEDVKPNGHAQNTLELVCARLNKT